MRVTKIKIKIVAGKLPSRYDAEQKGVHERKIEGTMTDVEIAPEFLELAGCKNHKSGEELK